MSRITHDPISLDEAIKVTEAWRIYYADAIGEQNPNSPNIFRGFTIPLSDLENLYNFAKENPEITGVRAYIAKGDCDANGVATGDKIHIVLLPIEGDAENTKPGSTVVPVTKDVYGKDGKSLIYDFTTPCPELCDFDSDLYKKK